MSSSEIENVVTPHEERKATELADSRKNLIALALAKAQAEIQVAVKGSDNPYFKSKYADLAEVWACIREPLTKNGLALVQCPSTCQNGFVTIETTIYHESGQSISSKLSCKVKDTGPQSIGSAITYLRRYAISAMCGVVSEEEDDDGNAEAYRSAPKKESHEKTVKILVRAFEAAGIGVEQLESEIKKKVSEINPKDINNLRVLYAQKIKEKKAAE